MKTILKLEVPNVHLLIRKARNTTETSVGAAEMPQPCRTSGSADHDSDYLNT